MHGSIYRLDPLRPEDLAPDAPPWHALVAQNVRLISTVLKKKHWRHTHDWQDAHQDAALELVRCAQYYRGAVARFSTYACCCMYGAIQSARGRRTRPMSYKFEFLRPRLNELCTQLEAKLQRTPTAKEIANEARRAAAPKRTLLSESLVAAMLFHRPHRPMPRFDGTDVEPAAPADVDESEAYTQLLARMSATLEPAGVDAMLRLGGLQTAHGPFQKPSPVAERARQILAADPVFQEANRRLHEPEPEAETTGPTGSMVSENVGTLLHIRTEGAPEWHQLVAENQKLIPWVMRRKKVYARQDDNFAADIFQIASAELVRCAQSFDPTAKVKFSTYAINCMEGLISTEMRKKRAPLTWRTSYHRAAILAAVEGARAAGEEPDFTVIGHEFGMSATAAKAVLTQPKIGAMPQRKTDDGGREEIDPEDTRPEHDGAEAALITARVAELLPPARQRAFLRFAGVEAASDARVREPQVETMRQKLRSDPAIRAAYERVYGHPPPDENEKTEEPL